MGFEDIIYRQKLFASVSSVTVLPIKKVGLPRSTDPEIPSNLFIKFGNILSKISSTSIVVRISEVLK